MTIRIISPPSGVPSITVPAPDDPYGTQVTFYAGQVLDVTPGGAWETAIGLSSLAALSGTPLADDQQGDGGEGTDNG